MDTKTDRHREDEVKTEGHRRMEGGRDAASGVLEGGRRPGRPQSGHGPANTSISDLFNCKRITSVVFSQPVCVLTEN